MSDLDRLIVLARRKGIHNAAGIVENADAELHALRSRLSDLELKLEERPDEGQAVVNVPYDDMSNLEWYIVAALFCSISAAVLMLLY